MEKKWLKWLGYAILGGLGGWGVVYGFTGLFGQVINDPALQVLGINLVPNNVGHQVNYFLSTVLFAIFIALLFHARRVRNSADLGVGILYLLLWGLAGGLFTGLFQKKFFIVFLLVPATITLSGGIIGWAIDRCLPFPAFTWEQKKAPFFYAGLALGLGLGLGLSLFTGAFTGLASFMAATVITYIGAAIGLFCRRRVAESCADY